MANFPTRLQQSPLTEAVFEIRFEPMAGVSSELLPGLLFTKLGKDFPTIQTSPLGMVPKQLREQNPDLRYTASFKLQGQNEAVLFGDQVLLLSVTGRYPGWNKFRERSVLVAGALRESGYVAAVQRYSLKYVNLLESRDSHDPVCSLNIQVDPSGYRMAHTGFKLRFETHVEGFLNIVECVSARTGTGSDARLGVMFSIDSIKEGRLDDFWADVPRKIEEAHSVVKAIFFNLLAKPALEAMGPSYD
jgi:uncharacterized protein (TIGR04255 family)